MRLFAGIQIPEELKLAIEQFKVVNKTNQQKELKWIKPENLHLTTCFLGERAPEELDAIVLKLQQICARHKSFELEFKKFDFSPGKTNRMIWAWFYDNLAFTALAEEMYHTFLTDKKLKKKPLPHVTVARFKKLFSSKQLNLDFSIRTQFRVDQIILWQSILHPEGAQYKKVNAFELK